MFNRTNFNSPFRPSLFFFKKRLRFQIQEQTFIIFAERRLLGKFVLRNFLLKNLSVAQINFYVNFLSSRKYDWNVAPKDLEKYGAPTAHASYFFKKN